MKNIQMERFQGHGANIQINRFHPSNRFQQIDWEFLNYFGKFQRFDPEILLPGFAENLRPGKRKTFCREENVGHVLGFAPAQGAQLIGQDIPPVIDARVKRRFPKISVVKRHIVDEIDLEGCLALAGQDPDEGVGSGSQNESDTAAAEDFQGFRDLLSKIRGLIDEQIDVIGIAMMEVISAERRSAREIKRGLRLSDQR